MIDSTVQDKLLTQTSYYQYYDYSRLYKDKSWGAALANQYDGAPTSIFDTTPSYYRLTSANVKILQD